MTSKAPWKLIEDKAKAQYFLTVTGTHLLTQNAKSEANGQCLYRCYLPEGRVLKCGIGWLIPDAEYLPTFEGAGVNMMESIQRAIGLDAPSHQLLNFLNELQSVHDGYMVSEWPKQLTGLAERFDLTFDGEREKRARYDRLQTAHVENLGVLLAQLARDVQIIEDLGAGAGDPLIDALNHIDQSTSRARVQANIVQDSTRYEEPLVKLREGAR